MVTRPLGRIVVQRADFTSPEAQALVRALNEELQGIYPEQAATHFRLDPDELSEGRGAFLLASTAGMPVGCGGIRRIAPGVGEIKRMYVAPLERRRGIAGALLAALEAEARGLGCTRLVLETGKRQPEAQALYTRAGFTHIPPYGEYVNSPLSVCFEKSLPASR